MKALFKKYRSLKKDLVLLEKKLKENPDMGDYPGNNIRKIRMGLSSQRIKAREVEQESLPIMYWLIV
jgi:hypothetical protein